MDMDRIKIVDNEDVYGEIRYKLIKAKYDFENNEKLNVRSRNYVIMVIKKIYDYDSIIYYARVDEDLNTIDAYMSNCVNDSPELMRKVEFYSNLIPTFFNKIYKYYV